MANLDWKNPKDYEYTSGLDAFGWAWEFLRRNPHYQNDYAALLSGSYAEYHYKPPKLTGESDEQWQSRCIFQKDVEPIKTGPQTNLAIKWGLKGGLRDPKLNAPELKASGSEVVFDLQEFPKILQTWDEVLDLPTVEPGTDEHQGSVILIAPDKVVLLFDLHEKITTQWNRVQKELLTKQEAWESENGKAQPSSPKTLLLPECIRALDARAAEPGLKFVEIAKIIFPALESGLSVKINNYLKTAEGHVAGGYLKIAASKALKN